MNAFRLIEKLGLDVIPFKLRHLNMMGGGPQCVTLDIRPTETLKRYLD